MPKRGGLTPRKRQEGDRTPGHSPECSGGRQRPIGGKKNVGVNKPPKTPGHPLGVQQTLTSISGEQTRQRYYHFGVSQKRMAGGYTQTMDERRCIEEPRKGKQAPMNDEAHKYPFAIDPASRGGSRASIACSDTRRLAFRRKRWSFSLFFSPFSLVRPRPPSSGEAIANCARAPEVLVSRARRRCLPRESSKKQTANTKEYSHFEDPERIAADPYQIIEDNQSRQLLSPAESCDRKAKMHSLTKETRVIKQGSLKSYKDTHTGSHRQGN